MKIIKQPDARFGFPFIAYAGEDLSDHPALIIHLHGIGERGNGGKDLDRVLTHGLPKVADDTNLTDCILVMPQCPSDAYWETKVESIKRFIDAVAEHYAADPGRIYLCGLSMGGFGTWTMAIRYPEMFAAVIPVCGGGMPWNAAVLNMPVWAFHGAEDSVVSPNHSDEMVARLKEAGKDVTYTRMDGVGHNVWIYAYTDDLMQWLLSKHK